VRAAILTTSSADPFTRGLDYLYGVRSLAPEAGVIDLVEQLEQRIPICTWIGTHIEQVNQTLAAHLQACHACFHAWQQPQLQIFATPLAQSFAIEALCNFNTDPITLLIDVGRVVPADWLGLVVHEYAHAQAGSPGHHQAFATSLTHLCLGLAIAPPQLGNEESLRFYPPCRPMEHPLAFWRGESDFVA
jgi:hypothetical protein